MTEPALAPPLVVRSPNWLGDAVMTLPAVRNLKVLTPDHPLTVATPEKLAALWEACPFVDHVIPLAQPKNIGAVATQLRAGGFATALLFPNSWRVALETLVAGIPNRIGYARGGRGVLLTRTLPQPVRDPVRLHQKFHYLDLAAALGAPADATAPALRPVTFSAGDSGHVALCPGAEYGPAKRWPLENFVAVGKAMLDRGDKIVILGAAGDAAQAGELAAQLPGSVNRAGQTTLTEFMAALAGARLVICNDSGAMHVASVLGVPTIAIFGSTEPQLTGPIGGNTTVLRHHVPCSPCFLRECPIDFACMRSITPDMVLGASNAQETNRPSALPSATPPR